MLADSTNLGWRLRVLRNRHDLTLVELAKLTRLDISYLSRLERDSLPNAKPKPDTINKVLDGLGATQHEREAVYHIERPPLSAADILWQVRDIAAQEEDAPEPLVLRDEHWFAWYYNRAARAVLGLTSDEYARMIGSHMLLEVIDPGLPQYSRFPSGNREYLFSLRARLFKVNFAGEEFDRWYLDLVSRIYAFPWAVRLWDHPRLDSQPLVIERQDITVITPLVGRMRLTLQMNRLLANPRFLLLNSTPVGRETATRLAEVRKKPEFGYDAASITTSVLAQLRGPGTPPTEPLDRSIQT